MILMRSSGAVAVLVTAPEPAPARLCRNMVKPGERSDLAAAGCEAGGGSAAAGDGTVAMGPSDGAATGCQRAQAPRACAMALGANHAIASQSL